MNTKTKIIVIEDHTLAVLPPNSQYATVLESSILEGSPITDPLSAMAPIFVIGKKIRLASRRDFEEFRVHFKGFDNCNEFEFAD